MCTTPALHFLLHPKKINQSEKRMLSCDCLDKICWLKWSRLHWTIAFEKIDLELILVRWHGNSGLVAFMDVTFICCEPNVLPCYWDVEPSPFCDPSLWCFVTEAFWEKKNTIADLPTFKDGAFPISVWMYPACVTKNPRPKHENLCNQKYVPVHIMLNAVWSRFNRKRSVFTISCLLFFLIVHYNDTQTFVWTKVKTRMCKWCYTYTEMCPM